MHSSKNIVYVYAPAGEIAGGTESLYQLVDSINRNGGYSCIVWNKHLSDPIPNKYSGYKVIHGEQVIDNKNNWIIYPEVSTQLIDTFKNLKKGIWWLSVDYNGGQFQDFQNGEITHFYQSFHALRYLQENRVEKLLPLFDYIPAKFTDLQTEVNKENIVCYNPAKGLEITEKIKLLNPDICFTPISGMNEEQIIDLLKKSKVYIDFGDHPGRDRIPREAAILGNCVLTNSKGSAGFYQDVPIDKKFKNCSVEQIGSLILDCFDNYELANQEYNLYRSFIKNQKDQLDNLVKQYFL
jgi:hypothetical protein